MTNNSYSSGKKTIILDTNILLISIPSKSPYRSIFDALINGEFNLGITNEIISEYHEIISEKTTSEIADNIIEMLLVLDNVMNIEVYYKWNLINQDKDDNKFVDCAIASRADFIVSNDKHFNVLKKVDFPTVKVLTVDEFLVLL